MLSRLIVTQQPLLALARSSLSKMPMRNQIIREFQQQGRETFTRSEHIAQRKTTIRERIMAPAGPKGNHSTFSCSVWRVENVLLPRSAFAVGRGALAGGAAVGLGALGFYGLGYGTQQGSIMNQSM